MLFSKILSPIDIADVHMNNVKIEYASSTRFLGVIIDDKLSFKLHINEITKKISKNIGVLYKLRQYVPNDTLTSVYRGIIECHIMLLSRKKGKDLIKSNYTQLLGHMHGCGYILDHRNFHSTPV